MEITTGPLEDVCITTDPKTGLPLVTSGRGVTIDDVRALDDE